MKYTDTIKIDVCKEYIPDTEATSTTMKKMI